MREIIFRGKSVNDGKWHEGSYISMLNKEYIADVQLHDIEEIKLEKAMNEVDPESLGQFTGVIDQHGTKVFEGDICEVIFLQGWFEVAVVVWHKDQQRYRLDPETGKTYSFSIPRSIKVIGNIHDNPGLLE